MINIIKNKLLLTKGVIDHPVYHPEKYLNYHILLVMIKALLWTRDINLVLAAMLHDIFKPNGVLTSTPEGSYISNTDHAKQAAQFIRETDDVKYFIKSLGGDYEVVANLCHYHMTKTITKKNKSIPLMDWFIYLDDMCERSFPPYYPIRNITIPVCDSSYSGNTYYNRKLWFVGQSQIQRHFKNNKWTLTFGKTPLVFHFSDIPLFFKGRFSPLQEYIKLLN